jgi:hypothetical protein
MRNRFGPRPARKLCVWAAPLQGVGLGTLILASTPPPSGHLFLKGAACFVNFAPTSSSGQPSVSISDYAVEGRYRMSAEGKTPAMSPTTRYYQGRSRLKAGTSSGLVSGCRRGSGPHTKGLPRGLPLGFFALFRGIFSTRRGGRYPAGFRCGHYRPTALKAASPSRCSGCLMNPEGR